MAPYAGIFVLPDEKKINDGDLAKRQQRILVLDPLRGLAALSVVWFHFVGTGHFSGEGNFAEFLTASGKYAWAGVEIFFVISGFVLPYALSRNGYRLRHFFVFLLKRLMRLEPPYIASIAIILIIAVMSPLVPGFHGAAFKFELPRLLSHVGYLTSFLNYEWYNIVYWTLAIELQFYLTIAILFPVLSHKKISIRLGVIMVLLLLSLCSKEDYLLLKYLPFFSLGIVTFHYYTGLLSSRSWCFSIAVIAVFCILVLGMAASIFGVAAALAIAASKSLEGDWSRNRVWIFLSWIGTLSYSLYLLHVPIGGRVINLGGRFLDGPLGQASILAMALLLSIFAAWLLHRLVEKPSQAWSTKIKFRNVRLPTPYASKESEVQ